MKRNSLKLNSADLTDKAAYLLRNLLRGVAFIGILVTLLISVARIRIAVHAYHLKQQKQSQKQIRNQS